LKQKPKISLKLVRDTFTDNSTMGELFLNDELFCDTLELPWLDNQRSISCIPEGSYDLRLRLPRESATREYIHLLVKDVPNRDYILFHRGNSAKDTRGCILVGKGTQQDIVHNSTLAMDLLIKEIINLGGENIRLTITRINKKKTKQMKEFLSKYLIGKMFQSKKFWYALSSVVVPAIVSFLGVDEETATKLFYALLTLVLGQGIADSAKK